MSDDTPALSSLDQVRRLVALLLWWGGLLVLLTEPAWLADGRVWLFGLFAALSVTPANRLTRIILLVALSGILLTGLKGDDWSIAWGALNFAIVFTIFLPTVLLIRETMAVTPETKASIAAFDTLGQGQRVAGLAVGCHLLSVVLVLGGLIASASFVNAQKDPALKRELGLVTMRGFALCVQWSPFTIGMGYALAFRPEVHLIEVMALGFLLTLAGMATAIGLARGWRGLASIPTALTSFRPIIGPIAVAVSLVVVAVSFTTLSTIEAVAVVMPFLCLIRLLAVGQRATGQALKKVFDNVHRMGDELLLFFAAAAIGLSIQSLGAADWVVSYFSLDQWGALQMIVLVIALGPCFAVMGLHPVVAGSIIVAFLAPLDSLLPDIVEIHLLLFVWSCGAFLSFGSISVPTAAKLFSMPISKLVFSDNIRYSLCFGAAVVLVLELWTMAAGV